MLKDTTKPTLAHKVQVDVVSAGAGHIALPAASSEGLNVATMLIDVVARTFRVTPRELRSRQRGAAEIALARQVAMYLVHCCCELSLTQAGYLFRRDRTTVAHACKRIEDLREDALFDWRIDRIERSVRALHKSIVMREAA